MKSSECAHLEFYSEFSLSLFTQCSRGNMSVKKCRLRLILYLHAESKKFFSDQPNHMRPSDFARKRSGCKLMMGEAKYRCTVFMERARALRT